MTANAGQRRVQFRPLFHGDLCFRVGDVDDVRPRFYCNSLFFPHDSAKVIAHIDEMSQPFPCSYVVSLLKMLVAI